VVPSVSVLLPVRNGSGTIAEAVQSLCEQTLRDIEIIIVDDGSTDETPAILAAAASADSRIRVLRHDTSRGIVEALNRAATEARAPVLARMDADDRCGPERLERQLALLQSDASLGVVSCLVRAVGGGLEHAGMRRHVDWLNALVTHEEIAASRFIESPVAHPSVMMRAPLLRDLGGYRDMGWAEDHDLWLRVLAAGWRIGKVPELLLDWRDSPGRLSRTDARYAHTRFLACKAHHMAMLPGVRTRGVQLSGGGPTGKGLARLLGDEGVQVHSFIDVHPRRIGGSINGVPVLPIEAIPWASDDSPIQLATSGTHGARERIRELLAERGHVEGHDFFCVA
jgi:cellulose synthase/poly-beta-1,6-N-acetylglucosamine synthase-like glycosyltransferase